MAEGLDRSAHFSWKPLVPHVQGIIPTPYMGSSEFLLVDLEMIPPLCLLQSRDPEAIF